MRHTYWSDRQLRLAITTFFFLFFVSFWVHIDGPNSRQRLWLFTLMTVMRDSFTKASSCMAMRMVHRIRPGYMPISEHYSAVPRSGRALKMWVIRGNDDFESISWVKFSCWCVSGLYTLMSNVIVSNFVRIKNKIIWMENYIMVK